MENKKVITTNENTKNKKLFLGILFDAIGMLSFTIPYIGEFGDVVWAPLAGFLMSKMYEGRVGRIAGVLTFVEEILPFTDVIPSFTLTWIYTYWINDKKLSNSTKKMIVDNFTPIDNQKLVFNKYFVENFLVNSFSKEQKLSVITLMRLISNGSHDTQKIKLQDKAIIEQASFLGLSFSECTIFLNNLNPETLKNELTSLNNEQKDFIVAMALGIISCGGTPSKRDYMITENAFEKIVGINIDEFSNRIEKIQLIGNHFLNKSKTK